MQQRHGAEVDRTRVTASVHLTSVAVTTQSVAPGALSTVTGTGERGATFRVLDPAGGELVPGTRTVGPDGVWTFDLSVPEGSFGVRFALEQTKNGVTETSNVFAIPADTHN